MLPSPSLGPPLLSVSWSPPLFWGMLDGACGGAAVVVVGGGGEVEVWRGGAVATGVLCVLTGC
jgi:hypothetical protein